MIGRYAEANMRMTEGCSLEQELSAIKEQVQPAMACLKENDLVVQRENEELAQSSARQILKAAIEKKRALAERKLIQARWQADIDGGDIA
ncbi:unnamed protein product, partial [Prunus brigantina]